MDCCNSCVLLRKIILSSIGKLESINKRLLSRISHISLQLNSNAVEFINDNDQLRLDLFKTIQEMKIKLVEEGEDLTPQQKKTSTKTTTDNGNEPQVIGLSGQTINSSLLQPNSNATDSPSNKTSEVPAMIIKVLPPNPPPTRSTSKQTVLRSLRPIEISSESHVQPLEIETGQQSNRNSPLLLNLLSPHIAIEVNNGQNSQNQSNPQPLLQTVPISNAITQDTRNSRNSDDCIFIPQMVVQDLLPQPSVTHQSSNPQQVSQPLPIAPKVINHNQMSTLKAQLAKPPMTVAQMIRNKSHVNQMRGNNAFLVRKIGESSTTSQVDQGLQDGNLGSYIMYKNTEKSDQTPNVLKRPAPPQPPSYSASMEEMAKKAKINQIQTSIPPMTQVTPGLIPVTLNYPNLDENTPCSFQIAHEETLPYQGGIIVIHQNRPYVVPVASGLINSLKRFTTPEELHQVKLGFVILSILSRKQRLLREILEKNVQEIKKAFSQTYVQRAYMIYRYLNKKQRQQAQDVVQQQLGCQQNMAPQYQQPVWQHVGPNTLNFSNNPNNIENFDLMQHGITAGGHFQFQFPSCRNEDNENSMSSAGPSQFNSSIAGRMNEKEPELANSKNRKQTDIKCPLPYCYLRFANLCDLEKHYNSFHQMKSPAIQTHCLHKCSLCEESFPSFTQFVSHARFHYSQVDFEPFLVPEETDTARTGEKDPFDEQSVSMGKLLDVEPSLSSITSTETTNELMNLLNMNFQNEKKNSLQEEEEKKIDTSVNCDIEIIDLSSESNSPGQSDLTKELFQTIFSKGLFSMKMEKDREMSNVSFNSSLDSLFSEELIKTEIFSNCMEGDPELEKDPLEFL